ncbi:MAG: phasin family protein [Candidatus Competibacteraceae bacterium]|nr:phasin family protein [Candidatus Competibacteraceae bacterium]MBK8754420.1 phasin family protein [Candidatus Competibacteraceae bacterium]
MVKKVLDNVDSPWSQSVQESAHLIWLAGLGASAKVSTEGGKLFEALVAEGAKIEEQTRAARVGTLETVREKTDETRSKMTDAWDKIEQIFEDRLARVLGQIGVPNRDDLLELTQRLNALNAQLDALRQAREDQP